MTVSKRKHLSEVLIIGGDWFWPFYLSTFETHHCVVQELSLQNTLLYL